MMTRELMDLRRNSYQKPYQNLLKSPKSTFSTGESQQLAPMTR